MVKTLYKDNSVAIVGREARYLERIKREKPGRVRFVQALKKI